MKYAYLSSRQCGIDSPFNFGDPIQAEQVINLYKYMGINDEDIIELPPNHVLDTSGPVVLVLNFHTCFPHTVNLIPTHPNIIPVFFGLCCRSTELLAHEDYFRSFQPIGCRDESTMKQLRRRNIRAFLSGCLTITLPKRKTEPKTKKAFFVDVPDELLPHIPKDISENAEFLSHYQFKGEHDKDFHETAEKMFNRYRDEATLVVTSRLHCASPCIAMGIPVIIVKKDLMMTFSWVDKFAQTYSADAFDKIDWNPKVADIEEHKKNVMETAAAMVREAVEKHGKIMELSCFYENRTASYYRDYLEERQGYLSDMDYYKISQNQFFAGMLENFKRRKIENTDLVVVGSGFMAKAFVAQINAIGRRYRKVNMLDNNAANHYKIISGIGNHSLEPAFDTNTTAGNEIQILPFDYLKEVKLSETMIVVAVGQREFFIQICNQLSKEYGLKEGRDFWWSEKLNVAQEINALKM